MAVSNPASFSSLQTEAGSADNNFSHYYRGGSIVGSNWSSVISPTADGLALSQFNGVSKPASIVFSVPNISKGGLTGKPAAATVTLAAAGTYTSTSGATGNWVTPTGGAYDVFVTAGTISDSGGLGSANLIGTFGSWMSVNSQSWGITIDAGSGGEHASVTLTFQFRKTGTTTVLATDTATFTATN